MLLTSKRVVELSLIVGALTMGTGAAHPGDGDVAPEKVRANAHASFVKVLDAFDENRELKHVPGPHTCKADPTAVCVACEKPCPIESLTYKLQSTPAMWEPLNKLIKEHFASAEATVASREGVFAVLTWSGPSGCETAEALYAEHATAFDPEHLLQFVEAGSEVLEEPLAKAAIGTGKGTASALPAAYFVARGDKKFASNVKRVASMEFDGHINPLEVLASAASLRGIGKVDALFKAQLRIHDACIASLDARDLATASKLAAIAEFFDAKVLRADSVALAPILQYAPSVIPARANQLHTEAQVFEVIERVTPN